MFKFCCEDCGECWYVGNPRTCKCLNEELQQPKQEQVKPVAWGMKKDGVILDVICPAEHEREEGEYTIPLYTHPKEWVGLTKEEINEGLLRSFYVLEKARAWRDGVAWATEQLKEKNT